MIDAQVLRRISLLVMRARQDRGVPDADLDRIAMLIDHLKRDVLLELPCVPNDLGQMAFLIGRLEPRDLPFGIGEELRELVSEATTANFSC
jgi:hypothetical protein